MVKETVDKWAPRGLDRAPGYTQADIDLIFKTLRKEPTGKMRRRAAERLRWLGACHALDQSWHLKPPPSEVAHQFEAIEKAATRLLGGLGAPVEYDIDDAPVDRLPDLIRCALVDAANGFAFKHPDFHSDGYPGLPRQGPYGDPTDNPYYDYRGDSALARAIESVQLLRAWSMRAREKIEKIRSEVEEAKGHGGKPTQGNASTPQRGGARHRGKEPENQLIRGLADIYREVTGKEPGISTKTDGTLTGPWLRFALACLAPLEIKMSPSTFAKRWHRLKKRRTDKSS